MKTQLGKRYRDKVTGYEGVAIARTEWLNGCFRVTLQGKVEKDGKYPDGHTIDEPQLELVDKGIADEHKRDTKTGGPIPKPQREPQARKGVMR